jgi:hypothetical protein
MNKSAILRAYKYAEYGVDYKPGKMHESQNTADMMDPLNPSSIDPTLQVGEEKVTNPVVTTDLTKESAIYSPPKEEDTNNVPGPIKPKDEPEQGLPLSWGTMTTETQGLRDVSDYSHKRTGEDKLDNKAASLGFSDAYTKKDPTAAIPPDIGNSTSMGSATAKKKKDITKGSYTGIGHIDKPVGKGLDTGTSTSYGVNKVNPGM